METYKGMVKNDIKKYFMDEVKQALKDNQGLEEAREQLCESLWAEDSVTGNGSGSYTFNTLLAKDLVLEHLEEVVDAYKELGYDPEKELGKVLINDNWEEADVTARCANLNDAIDEILAELPISKY